MSGDQPFSRNPTPVSNYTDEQLKRCMELAAELSAVEGLLPRDLFILADTWRVDMLVQQEDRESGKARRRL